MNEFQLIARFFDWPACNADLGVGDDAALMTLGAGMQLAVSADMLVEGRHFFAGADAFSLGRKALAVNLSDMAAMGAIPRWFTLSLALPEVNTGWLDPFSQGLRSMADEYGVTLVGGDTTCGSLTLAIQIMGEVEQNNALLRSGGLPGHDLWVSGHLGAAAATVMHRMGRISLHEDTLSLCQPCLDSPVPRVALGRCLHGVASAVLDISDGLLGDVRHICERSGCGAEIELLRVPYPPELNQLPEALLHEAILAGGDDYELCFSAPSTQRAAIEAISLELRLHLSRIGSLVARPGVRVMSPEGTPIQLVRAGFDHFS